MSLKVTNLTKTFDGKTVVNDISFEVQPGEIVGLLGPNGAGKTTSFDMVVGLVKPEQGDITLSDNVITNLPVHERSRSGLGYLTQEPYVFRRLTVEDNLRLVLQDRNNASPEDQNKKLEKLLDEFHLQELRDHI